MQMLNIGDKFTIGGIYAKRTFMQWLKGEPKKLQQMVVKNHCTSYTEYKMAKPEKIEPNPQKP